MFLHQETNIPTNSIDAVTTNLRTISILQIHTHFIATIPNKLTCILEVEIDEVTSIKITQLVMIPVVHVKDAVEPAQVLLTYKFVRQCYTHS